MSRHPSEQADPEATPVTVEAGPSSDPLLIWLGFMGKRLDAALAAHDQAYRDAKVAATNVDTAARKARTTRLEADPAGLSEGISLDIEPDAQHRTHLRAMETHGQIACALVSSVREMMLGSAIEVEQRIIA